MHRASAFPFTSSFVLAATTAVTLTACSGAHVAARVNPAGREGASIRTFTDSDVVTGATMTGTDVYVSTLRGVLKYPSDGGAATRLTSTQGLPDDRVVGISGAEDGTVWVATARGPARLANGRFNMVGEVGAQPNVGPVTAVYALGEGQALLGGAQGLAKWDGHHWVMLTDRYQVVQITKQLAGKVLVATAQNGVLAYDPASTSLDELGLESGIPELLVRAVVPVGAGRFWALVQGQTSGAKLAYYNGRRWYGYSHANVRTPWLGLVSMRSGTSVGLVTRGALYEITPERGEELVALEEGGIDAMRHVALEPEVLVPPPPPPAPPAAPPTPRRGGRGRAPAARAHKEIPTRNQSSFFSPIELPPAMAPVPVNRGAQTVATDAGTSRDAASTPDASAPDAAPTVARVPPPRPRSIPAYTEPAVARREGAPIEAPRFGLTRSTDLVVPEDLSAVYSDASRVFLSRIGLGVTRIEGRTHVDYRSHDLAMSHRPLALATDPANNVWLVTEDGGSARYDGTRFSRIGLDADDTVKPLMFWSHGTTVAAVGRVGNNTLRTYRWAGNGWQQVTERPIDTRGPGVVDVKFLAVDAANRYWVGIRVEGVNAAGQPRVRELGVAVIDEHMPAATQFNTQVAPRGAEQGAVRAPDDLTAVDFDRDGRAWFAGLSGAVSIKLAGEPGASAEVHTYDETNGLHGGTVTDVAHVRLAADDRVYIATTEGLGYYDGARFAFDIEGSAALPRTLALAVDIDGHLWGAGQHGGWMWNGTVFRHVGTADGLPTEQFNDLAIDGENRVWFVTDEGISVLGNGH